MTDVPTDVSESGEAKMPDGWRYRYERAGEDDTREWSDWNVVSWEPNRKAFSVPVEIQPLYASPSPQHIGDAGGVEPVAYADRYVVDRLVPNEEVGTMYGKPQDQFSIPLYAALPPARVEAAPRVKPLVWAEGDGQSSATSPFGAWYFVHQNGDEWFIHYGATEGGYSSREEAKAAAQADYAARILSALQSEQPK